MRARAENGEELSGVRPYTLEVDGDEEWVYVLQLEGKPGFAQARKRWGFRNNPGNNPPHFDLDELTVLERAGGMLRWVQEIAGLRSSTSRKVQLAAAGTTGTKKTVALTADGVSWAKLGLPKMLVDNSEATRVLDGAGLQLLDATKEAACGALGAAEARTCRAELMQKARAYAGNVPVSSATSRRTSSGDDEPDDPEQEESELDRLARLYMQEVTRLDGDGGANARKEMRRVTRSSIIIAKDLEDPNVMPHQATLDFMSSVAHFATRRKDAAYTPTCPLDGEEDGAADVLEHAGRSSTWAFRFAEIFDAKWAATYTNVAGERQPVGCQYKKKPSAPPSSRGRRSPATTARRRRPASSPTCSARSTSGWRRTRGSATTRRTRTPTATRTAR